MKAGTQVVFYRAINNRSMGAAESRAPEKVLTEAEELVLFAYVVDNCRINPPIPDSLLTYNDRGCSSDIPAIIRKYGKSSGLDMVVYRGQYDKKEISYDTSKPFFSVTKDPEYAHSFASKLYDEKGEEEKWGIDCCVFKIHLQNVQILDLKEISFDRVLSSPPPIVNLDDDKVSILEKFKRLVNNESEILVLGGGGFYTSPACRKKGCIAPPAFDVPDEEFHQFHETWYSMPEPEAEADPKPFKRPRRGGRTRRTFKSYCKKKPCRRMGFTQKAGCRPRKNC